MCWFRPVILRAHLVDGIPVFYVSFKHNVREWVECGTFGMEQKLKGGIIFKFKTFNFIKFICEKLYLLNKVVILFIYPSLRKTSL